MSKNKKLNENELNSVVGGMRNFNMEGTSFSGDFIVLEKGDRSIYDDISPDICGIVEYPEELKK